MLATQQVVRHFKSKPDCLINLTIKASICHKSSLPPRECYRWPYEKRFYGYSNFWLDPFTKKKFNENSKLIQIEGNVACGKEDFGRRLADELDMKYMEEVDLESYYRNEHGYDYRALNPLLPERLRLCDWEMFHENPARHSVIHMQNFLFKLRLFQYIKAMQHLFNTGQGVIFNRTIFTERVFVDAMHKMGWLPMGYLRGDGIRFYDWKLRYNYIRNLVLYPLPKPHLTIYLETSVEKCLENIKNSNNPMISNSNALVPEFLENMEEVYEEIVLPKQDYNGHVIRVNAENRLTDGQIMDVIDDISQLDYEYDDHDTRFGKWNHEFYTFWHTNTRIIYTSFRQRALAKHFNAPWFDIAGLGDSISQVDIRLRQGLFEGHVGPLGHLLSYNSDTKVTSPLKAFLDMNNFEKRQKSWWYTDFV